MNQPMYLLIAPILCLSLTALLNLIAMSRLGLQRIITLIGFLVYTLIAISLWRHVQTHGIIATQMGNWQAPFGITFVADLLSALMILLTAIIGLVATLFSWVNIDNRRAGIGGYYPLSCFMLMGVSWAFLTGDLFNMYVAFELLLISSFVLLTLGSTSRGLFNTLQYVVINLISSSFFLVGLGVLYGLTGTLNMAHVAVRVAELSADPQQSGLLTMLAIFFIIAFSIKSALFPFHFWVPLAYPYPPITITIQFAGLLTKVGAYALIRVFTLLFPHNDFLFTLLLISSALTMVIGVLGAVVQYDVRRILAFHSISQIGYITMGLALIHYSQQPILALAGTIFFIFHHSLVKASLFLLSEIMAWLGGSFDLKKLGGLIETRPLLAVLFFISALSLAGLPPLSGFWAKLLLIRAGLDSTQMWIAFLALAVSFFTLYSMVKIWLFAFWQAPPESANRPKKSDRSALGYFFPAILMTILIVAIGLSAESSYQLAQQAATQLLDPTPYIQAVLPQQGVTTP